MSKAKILFAGSPQQMDFLKSDGSLEGNWFDEIFSVKYGDKEPLAFAAVLAVAEALIPFTSAKILVLAEDEDGHWSVKKDLQGKMSPVPAEAEAAAETPLPESPRKRKETSDHLWEEQAKQIPGRRGAKKVWVCARCEKSRPWHPASPKADGCKGPKDFPSATGKKLKVLKGRNQKPEAPPIPAPADGEATQN